MASNEDHGRQITPGDGTHRRVTPETPLDRFAKEVALEHDRLGDLDEEETDSAHVRRLDLAD